MATAHLGLTNTYIAGIPPSAADLNLRANFMDTQAVGSLRGLGSGVLFPDPAATLALSPELKVSAGSGLHVVAAAGFGIIVEETYGAVFVENVAGFTVGDGDEDVLEDDSDDNYLFLSIEVEVSGNDSRFSAIPKFVVQDSDELPGAILLAQIHTESGAVASIDDLRKVNRWDNALFLIAALQAAITALQNDIGYPYDEGAVGTIAARLDALDGGGVAELDADTLEGHHSTYFEGLTADVQTNLDAHIADDDNPHGVTAAQAEAVALADVGEANGVAPLDGDGLLPIEFIPAALLGAVNYRGTWNANTNSPTIPTADSGNKGYYYRVAVAGSTNIDGISSWAIGDWIISNGTVWEKVDSTDAVSSVQARTGAVVLDDTDISSTVDDTEESTGNTGSLRELFSWLANQIKAITGKSTWRTAPAISLETLNLHASRHVDGGDDEIALDELAPPTDITTLNASESAHGLVPKLPGDATKFFNGNGTYSTPPGSGYWVTLVRSSTDPQTILEAIAAAIAQHVEDYHSDTGGIGTSGGTVERHRDETAVNGLDTLYRILVMDEDQITDIPPYRAAVHSPGRGNWEDTYDPDFTTCALDEINHTVG